MFSLLLFTFCSSHILIFAHVLLWPESLRDLRLWLIIFLSDIDYTFLSVYFILCCHLMLWPLWYHGNLNCAKNKELPFQLTVMTYKIIYSPERIDKPLLNVNDLITLFLSQPFLLNLFIMPHSDCSLVLHMVLKKIIPLQYSRPSQM